jgi:hypothetical protein
MPKIPKREASKNITAIRLLDDSDSESESKYTKPIGLYVPFIGIPPTPETPNNKTRYFPYRRPTNNEEDSCENEFNIDPNGSFIVKA